MRTKAEVDAQDGTAIRAALKAAVDNADRLSVNMELPTEQGLAVLDGDNRLLRLVDDMLDAAIARGREMADDARRG